MKKRPLEERFWDKVNKQGPNDCWIWLDALDKNGYGVLKIGKKCGKHFRIKAHRLSYKIHYCDPGSLFVCHHCDNPSCVNPKHLFLGTHKDNMRDAINKNRAIVGEHNPKAKLTETQVKEIKCKLLYKNTIELSKEYNISTGAIQDIKHNRSWKNIK